MTPNRKTKLFNQTSLWPRGQGSGAKNEMEIITGALNNWSILCSHWLAANLTANGDGSVKAHKGASDSNKIRQPISYIYGHERDYT